MKTLFFILFLPFSLLLRSQDSLPLTKNFHFADGAYLSFEEFRANKPSYPLDSLEVGFFTNPQTFLTQVDSLVVEKTGQALDPEKVWAISMDGIPYVRLSEGELQRELPTFAALKLRGKICYFAYPAQRMKKVAVAAYNPLNGRPFRTGVVEREEEIYVEKMLHFETGEVTDFTTENFLQWIQDDPSLVETVLALPAEDKEKKLFKCLLIYVDRNEAFVRD